MRINVFIIISDCLTFPVKKLLDKFGLFNTYITTHLLRTFGLDFRKVLEEIYRKLQYGDTFSQQFKGLHRFPIKMNGFVFVVGFKLLIDFKIILLATPIYGETS